MEAKAFSTYHLIKSEDLNHHGTLFAGRGTEWFVEAGFVACAGYVNTENIVCLVIHGLHFTKPAKLGQVVCYKSKIVYAGKTSLTAHISVFLQNKEEIHLLDGFATFVNVDSQTKTTPHGIVITPKTEEDIKLYEAAKNLKKQ